MKTFTIVEIFVAICILMVLVGWIPAIISQHGVRGERVGKINNITYDGNSWKTELSTTEQQSLIFYVDASSLQILAKLRKASRLAKNVEVSYTRYNVTDVKFLDEEGGVKEIKISDKEVEDMNLNLTL